MPDQDFPGSDSLKQHNLEITVENEATARRITEAVGDSGPDIQITLDAEEDRRAALRGEMADELGAVVAGPGNVGPQTKAQNKGSMKWAAIGAVVGAALMFVVGLFAWPTGTGMIMTTVIGIVGGGTAGLVIGGSMGPRVYDEGSGDVSSQKVVGIHSDDPSEIEAARRAIGNTQVTRVDEVNAAGTPVGSPSKDTRPVSGEPPT